MLTRRKSFQRELKQEGKAGTLSEQREAALAFKKEMLAQKKEQERMLRREREQSYLTPKQLREAKAAFAIFDEIPDRNKSLVDAVVLYREHLKLAVDSPLLQDCIDIFLGRKKEAVEKRLLSNTTYLTLKKRLNPFRNYFAEKYPTARIGDVTTRQLINFFESLDVAERTLLNYVKDIGNFFNDASNPKDENRFINKNPMDGVMVHFKKFNTTKALKVAKHERKIPTILQLDQIKRVLEVAFKERKHGFLGFTVCGLFLGLRPSEIFDLVKEPDYWERFVRLDEGLLRLEGFGKQRDQRTIIMPENAITWLRYLQAESLPLCFNYNPKSSNVRYANFRADAFLPEEDATRLKKLRRAWVKKHKLTPEEKAFSNACNKILADHQDVLRHTFGTNYYYAHGFDKNKTVQQMGNSGEVFIDHYRGLLNHPDDAKLYFELTHNKLEPDAKVAP